MPPLEGPLSPPPNTPRQSKATDEQDFEEGLDFAETTETSDFDPVTEPQFSLEDVESFQDRGLSLTGLRLDERAPSAMSDAMYETSSEASFETVILAASEPDDRSWSYSEGKNTFLFWNLFFSY